MNNFSKFLFGGALLFGLWSCASDEPIVTEIPKFDGDEAVMTINIYGTSDITRADGSGAHYENGSPDENDVTKLNFYFYDKYGEFVTCYEGAKYEPTGESSTLVEEIGTSRIVLTNLLGQNYPSYLVAVLNYTGDTKDFQQSLYNVAKLVRKDEAPWKVSSGSTTGFIMTNATHSKNSDEFFYMATPINEENFAIQGPSSKPDEGWPVSNPDDSENKAKPVDIYVERLASKVELVLPSSLGTVTEEGYYDITLPDDYVIDGKEGQKLKVRLYGWGVNGTAKEMRYFKAVNDKPNPFKTTDGWDYNGTNRCYWAKTPGYGKYDYSPNFEKVTNKGSSTSTKDTDDTAPNEPLNYISWKTVKDNNLSNKIAYVMPHTEAGEKINLKNNDILHTAITEVLIAGKIIDNDGKGITLFKLGESYYTKDGVINYLLNAAGTHIWKEVVTEGEGSNTKKFVTIAPGDVEVKYGYDGTFRIALTEAAKALTWYQDEYGTDKYKWESSDKVEAEINAYLPDKQSFCYNDGMLYYNIPIKHLREYKAKEEIKTGMFGVVRNHWYQITVSGVKKLGHSVYREHEHILPPSDDTRYMIGSSVKILSWRMVKSTVEL